MAESRHSVGELKDASIGRRRKSARRENRDRSKRCSSLTSILRRRRLRSDDAVTRLRAERREALCPGRDDSSPEDRCSGPAGSSKSNCPIAMLKDYDAAVVWYRKAAEQCNAMGELLLGGMQ